MTDDLVQILDQMLERHGKVVIVRAADMDLPGTRDFIVVGEPPAFEINAPYRSAWPESTRREHLLSAVRKLGRHAG